MTRFWLILATFLGLAATALPASADIVYTLNCDSLACGSPSNYGTVTLHQVGSGSSAYVEVTVLLAPNNYAGTGAGYAINWNITNNPSLTTTVVPTDASHPLLAGQIYDASHFEIKDSTVSGKTYKASPFGSSWMYAIDYKVTGGKDTNDNKLIFDVTKNGGLLLSDFAATADGFYFAVDIFGGPCHPTCVVASNTHTQVPEPGTVTMSIAGLMGLVGFAMIQRRRKLARA